MYFGVYFSGVLLAEVTTTTTTTTGRPWRTFAWQTSTTSPRSTRWRCSSTPAPAPP